MPREEQENSDHAERQADIGAPSESMQEEQSGSNISTVTENAGKGVHNGRARVRFDPVVEHARTTTRSADTEDPNESMPGERFEIFYSSINENAPRRDYNVGGHDWLGSLTERAMTTARSSVSSEGFKNINRPLLKAIFKGDWEYANKCFSGNLSLAMTKLTGRRETALHIAALSTHDEFFENLVGILPQDPDVLEMVDKDGRTALHIAILCGRIKMVQALIEHAPNLPQLSNDEANILLVASAEVSMHKDIAKFLAQKIAGNCPSFFESPSAIRPIIDFTIAGHYDIVLPIVKKYPHLLTKEDQFLEREHLSILGVLARADSHFLCKNTLSVLEALIFKCIPVDWSYEPTDEYSRNTQASTTPAPQSEGLDIPLAHNQESDQTVTMLSEEQENSNHEEPPTDIPSARNQASNQTATMPSEEQENLNHAEPQTDIPSARNQASNQTATMPSAEQENLNHEEPQTDIPSARNQASNQMATMPSEEQENWNHAERLIDFRLEIPLAHIQERNQTATMPSEEQENLNQAERPAVLQCFSRPLWNAAKILVPKIKRIHEKKLRYVAAVELTKTACEGVSSMEDEEIVHYFQKDEIFRQAIVKGNSEFLKICIQFFPEIFSSLPEGRKLMKRAVMYRQERTLSLFLKVTSTNELSLVPAPTPEGKREIMLAAVKQYSHFNVGTYISGAAFQMQRELQWFNAVESWLFPGKRVFTLEGKTFWALFMESHQEMREKGEKWVKDAADKCMLVSTLIATVLFAAAFTVPGGNDPKNGIPLLLGQDSVLTFAISNALGLFSSITAILLFLAILTSPYEPDDFLHSLPKKIIMGLSFLFLSLAFMLVAFVATLKISLDKRLEWAFIPITLLASLPVVLFLRQQLPLLLQMVKSTYGPRIFRPKDIWK